MNQFKLMIPQATAMGYVTCPPRSVFDLNYPDSKNRRGRVQGGGKICPTLTATMGELLVFEDVYEECEQDDKGAGLLHQAKPLSPQQRGDL